MKDSFKLEDTYGKKKKANNNFLIYFLIGIIIISFIGYIIFNNVISSINYISKKDENKEYVYMVEHQSNMHEEGIVDKIPVINLDLETIDELNNSIMNNYLEVSKKGEYDYSYEYSKSENILALKITYAYFQSNTSMYPMRYFETFNIDLKTGKILTDDEILKKYNLSKERVNIFIGSKFKGFYNDLVDAKYYTEQECNYKCFLKNRGISDNYLNGVSYYIEDGSLTAFKYFYTYSDYNEEEYFKNENYQFIVKE